jgi:hypothetical protein
VTLQSPPAYLQAGTYTAISDRLHLNTIRSNKDASDTFRALQGFFPDRFPAYSNPSGMNWSVGPCAGIVTNTFVSGGGDYAFANPSNITGSFAASSPTLNRYDILGFRVRDNFYDTLGFNDIVPVVIQGANSAGTPVDPALPASFIPIVRAVVNATVTSPTLQDLRTRTVPSGGVLPVASAAIRTALGVVHTGFLISRTDKNWVEVYDGTAWRVQGTVKTGALADITDPLAGQLALLTTDNYLYRYTGSAWIAVQCFSPTGGIVQYKRTGGSGTVSSGTATKLGFGAAVSVDTSIVVVSGAGNTDFTIQRDGTYDLNATVPWVTASSGTHSYWGYIALAGNQAVRIAANTDGPNNYQAILNPNKPVRLTAGTALSVFCFQDSASGKDISMAEVDCDFTIKFTGP